MKQASWNIDEHRKRERKAKAAAKQPDKMNSKQEKTNG